MADHPKKWPLTSIRARKSGQGEGLLELLTGAGDAEWSSAWREGDLVVFDGEGDHASFSSDDTGAPPPKTSMAAWSMI